MSTYVCMYVCMYEFYGCTFMFSCIQASFSVKDQDNGPLQCRDWKRIGIYTPFQSQAQRIIHIST